MLSLVREIDDLFNDVFPLVKEWVTRQGDLSGVTRQGELKLGDVTWQHIGGNGFERKTTVRKTTVIPPYWKLPRIEGQKMHLEVQLVVDSKLTIPLWDWGPFAFSGGITVPKERGDTRLSLFLKTTGEDMNLSVLSKLRPKLRSFLAHELEHLRDPNSYYPRRFHYYPGSKDGRNPLNDGGENAFWEYYWYVSSPKEIVAKSRDIFELSKEKKVTMKDELDRYLERVAGRLKQQADADDKNGVHRAKLIPSLLSMLRASYLAYLPERFS